MRQTSLKILLLSLVICSLTWGCTLIAEVDRSEIPSGMGGADAEPEEE